MYLEVCEFLVFLITNTCNKLNHARSFILYCSREVNRYILLIKCKGHLHHELLTKHEVKIVGYWSNSFFVLLEKLPVVVDVLFILDCLLSQPIDPNSKEMPSPAALKHKIILKVNHNHSNLCRIIVVWFVLVLNKMKSVFEPSRTSWKQPVYYRITVDI